MTVDKSGREGTFRRRIYDNSPSIFRRFYGIRFAGTVGQMLDSTMEAIQDSALAPFIETGLYAYDALRYIGEETSIKLTPVDTHKTYRDRLRSSWATWQKAGTEGVIETQLDLLGYPGAVVARDTSYGSRFDFTVTLPSTSHGVTDYGSPLGTFALGSPSSVLGPTGLTSQEAYSIKQVVLNFKPSRYRFTNLVLEPPSGPDHIVPMQSS